MDRSYYMENLYTEVIHTSRMKMDDLVVSAELILASWGLAIAGEDEPHMEKWQEMEVEL